MLGFHFRAENDATPASDLPQAINKAIGRPILALDHLVAHPLQRTAWASLEALMHCRVEKKWHIFPDISPS
jgi:hypothetical protein